MLPTRYTYTGQYSNTSEFGWLFYNTRWFDPYPSPSRDTRLRTSQSGSSVQVRLKAPPSASPVACPSAPGQFSAIFVYTDADGVRVKGTVSGATTLYLGNYFEWNSGVGTKYYYAGAQRIAMQQGSTLYWLFGDHLGSVSRAANADGTPLTNGEQRYRPWGEKRYPTGASGLPTTFRYTGQRQEDYIKLYWIGSRWYDDALGRWTQPDVIVPDPLTPVDLDRYSYTRNNPVRYSDASGHCTGDPNDPKNSDRACWKKFYRIKEEFPNVFMNGYDWTKQQLKLIFESLKLTRNAFGGQQGFVNALGNFSIAKTDLSGIRAIGAAPAGPDIVWLDPSMFAQDEIDVIFGIIHEISHIFDFKGSGRDPDLYKSQTFVDFYAPGCDTGYFGCVSATSNYPINPGGANFGWNPDSLATSWYGLNSSIDDFADSFAAYVMEFGGLTPPRNVSGERKMIIALWIERSK